MTKLCSSTTKFSLNNLNISEKGGLSLTLYNFVNVVLLFLLDAYAENNLYNKVV